MLLDDHEMVRQGIALGLNAEADIQVTGSYGTGRQLLEALARQRVDVVVMDFVLGFGAHEDPVGSTIAAIKEARQRGVITRDETVVAVVTASGLKDIDRSASPDTATPFGDVESALAVFANGGLH